jgi:SAM-dependent methyltransferase
MAHTEQYDYVRTVVARHPEFFRGTRVLEVGSRDINGGVRDLFADCVYTGLDCIPGLGVDVVCMAHEFWTPEPYDLVISCEALEHDPNPGRTLAHVLGCCLRPGGLFVCTCAGPGRAEHGTARTGEVYGPHSWYYANLAPDDFRRMVLPWLTSLEVIMGRAGQDLYAKGFRREDLA